jgi:beta-N-acetylhexosaminidase
MTVHPVDHLLLLSFQGDTPPPGVLEAIGRGSPGITFFRGHNDVDAAGMVAMTERLWAAAGEVPPIVAVDQEGGQLEAAGAATTSFPGNMALGAAADPALTERVGAAMGRELRALGFTVNLAPDADLASNPDNPGAGIRSFGDDHSAVSDHVAAMVRGIQASGVAATLKHFPGKGEASIDTHHGLAQIDRSAEQVREVDAAPFKAGIEAGAAVVMSGHHALPSVTGRVDIPCTLASEAMTDLLRGEFGFDGLAITDALDMAALNQEGVAQAIDLIAAVIAGNDLLLSTPESGQIERVLMVLRGAADRGVIPSGRITEAANRVAALRRRLAEFGRPDPSIVRCESHRRLAAEVAERSVTRVRGAAAPLVAADRVLVIEPAHDAVTPADTSAWAGAGGLATALRTHLPVDSIVVPSASAPSDIAAAVAAAREVGAVVVATANAHFVSGQAEMGRAILEARPDAVTVALRVPWDLWSYPASTSHWSTYAVQEVSLVALAASLVGEAEAPGRMPVGGVV